MKLKHHPRIAEFTVNTELLVYPPKTLPTFTSYLPILSAALVVMVIALTVFYNAAVASDLHSSGLVSSVLNGQSLIEHTEEVGFIFDKPPARVSLK